MDVLIEELLNYFEARAEAFGQVRHDSQVDLFCGIFTSRAQGGFVLHADITRRAAANDLPIGFDIYGA